jgi:GMP synthase PP-ATPase subunit
MTRKHFVAVARILSETEGMKNPETVRRHIARELSALFRESNPRFDVDWFLAAANVDII